MTRSKFTRIAGLSDVRRLPRLGKIHLGRKHEEKGYPVKSDHFVVPPEVAAVYGEEPRVLDVLLPCDDPEVFAGQARRCYRGGKLFCKGDGRTAGRSTPDYSGIEEVTCPCPLSEGKDNKGPDCKPVLQLQVILPLVSLGGVYQIDTSSYNSIVNINSGLAFIEGVAGGLSQVKATLALRPQPATVDGKVTTVYVMHLTLPSHQRLAELGAELDAVMGMLRGAAPRAVLPPPPPPPAVVVDPADEEPPADFATAEPAAAAPASPPQGASVTGSELLMLEGEASRLGFKLGKPRKALAAAIATAKKDGTLPNLVKTFNDELDAEARQGALA